MRGLSASWEIGGMNRAGVARRGWHWLVVLLLGLGLGPASVGAESFRVDVLPVLTKAGCNAGACHGAATGQGGLRLSLLGYDADEDHERLTREQGGRRIDLGLPEESLLLRKASGAIDHEGGRRLRRGSEGYERVRRWIEEGAAIGDREVQVAGVMVEPGEVLAAGPGEDHVLRVTATHSDGSRRDVTAWALYTSNDDAVAVVSKTGEVRTTGRGWTAVMVRYGGQVAAARVRVPWAAVGSGTGRDGGGSSHVIDRLVGEELGRMGVPVSGASEDGEFLRRVTLDLAGRLPSLEEARTFLAEAPSSTKRMRAVDRLLDSGEFVDFWTGKLADLLLVGGRPEVEATYQGWLREVVRTNGPLDGWARSLLVATGDAAKVGPAGFSLLANDPRDLAEHAARIFLGTRIGCARCHAHPSDRWTQEDYHRFAAFFARLTREDGAIAVSGSGEVEHPKTGRVLEPRGLGERGSGLAAKAPGSAEAGDRRVALAEWLTASENPFFARAMANRIWRHLLGRGLVEPVDDLRPTNPASHPELLEALAGELRRSGYDLRHLIRWIVASETYQRSGRSRDGNATDRTLFARAYPKELPAAVLVDAVAQVLGVPDRYEGYPPGTRAVQLRGPGTPSVALDLLGRCSRKRPCESATGGVGAGGGLAAALHLLNGSTISGKLRGGTVATWAGRPDRDVVEELYLRALTRRPTEAERLEWEGWLGRAENRGEALEDLAWAMLNSREFGMNR